MMSVSILSYLLTSCDHVQEQFKAINSSTYVTLTRAHNAQLIKGKQRWWLVMLLRKASEITSAVLIVSMSFHQLSPHFKDFSPDHLIPAPAPHPLITPAVQSLASLQGILPRLWTWILRRSSNTFGLSVVRKHVYSLVSSVCGQGCVVERLQPC